MSVRKKLSGYMKLEIPEKARKIIEIITAAGFEAYVVGGCVRDSILGRVPQDWDITTSASPVQVKELFPRTVDTGIAHGTVTVMMGKEGFEVTTYRIDGEYEDNRHPREVTFTSRLEEDLKRRDFTINAMAYNDTAGLVDIFGGIADMESKTIRCVGEARERFTEDALRILRAVRFSGQLGYAIEEETARAITELAPNLQKISAERIQAELTKLLISPHPEILEKAWELGVTAVVLPEFDKMMETPQNHPHHRYNVGEHTLRGLLEVEPVKELRLAVLFHDIGKPDTTTTDAAGINHFYEHEEVGREKTQEILRRLRFDNVTISRVTRLVQYHDYGNGTVPTPRLVRRALHKVGEDIFPWLLAVKRADILSQSEYKRKEKLENLADWQQMYQEILDREECVSLKDLAVNGSDLIAAGMKPGKELGQVLDRLLELVLEEPERNTKEWLLSRAKDIL